MNFLCHAIGMKHLCNNEKGALLEKNFIAHLNEFGLSYGTKEEFMFRFQIFAQKDAEIQEINARETTF